MNSEDRNLELLTCKNTMNIMVDIMQDIVMAYDNAIIDILDARYRIAISTLETARERLNIKRKESL